MTSTPYPACSLCGLRYASKPLLELHIREDHRPLRRARSGRPGVVRGARATSPAAGSSSRPSGLAFRPSRAVKAVTAMTVIRRQRSGQVLTFPRRVLRALRHVNDELLRASEALMRLPRAPQSGPRAQAVGQSGGRGPAFGARRLHPHPVQTRNELRTWRDRRASDGSKPHRPAGTGEKEGGMTGTTTLGLISIAIVLARLLALSVRAAVGVCLEGGLAAAGAEA